MNLYKHCKSCKEDIVIKSSSATRPDLQMEKGTEFQINCQNCGNIEKVHVNDIKGEPNKKMILIGLVLGVIATAIMWIFFGAIGTLGAIIPLLFWQQQMNASKTFNSYLIKR